MHRFLTFLLLSFACLTGSFAADAPPARPVDKTPHIALLLPLQSASFGRAADAVRKGFMAGFSISPAQLPVKVYAADEAADNIVSAYLSAVQEGAKVVIGPLTRNAVTHLAASGLIGVPTLALNATDGDDFIPPNLYLFGLSAETEARQIARTAFTEGRRNAFIVSSGTPLAKRIQQAFLEEWEKLDGEVAAQLILPKSQEGLLGLRETSAKSSADMIFLAMDADKTLLVRPYLNPIAVTYATSQVFTGRANRLQNVDLNGVRFVDMPWLLEPDHPAVMVYPRPEPLGGVELERLYALGIDASRLAISLAGGEVRNGFAMDGVTGKISLKGQLFERELTAAQFQEGEVVLAGKPQP
jgi:outer membrane PBP1 activator LpoA protein